MKKIVVFLTLLLTANTLYAQKINPQSHSMGNARVEVVNNTITVNSGKIERSWSITEHGLLTKSIRNVERNSDYPITVSHLLA